MMRGIIGFVILVLSLIAITEANHKYLYGCVIDAGSSGSRIYIYTWLHRNNNTLPNLSTAPLNQTQWSKKVSPGLSKYATNITGIPDYLSGLISYATGLLPASEISETPLYLKATGGLRALSQADQDTIMTNTRRYLHTTPFSFQDSYAQVIPLETESLFGWIAANYLKGLAGSSAPTAGALDMGGASTEIAFVSAATQNYSTVSLGEGYTYTVFASGFNARGQDDAFAITNAFLGNGKDPSMPIEHPCYNVGFNESWPLSSTVSYLFYGTGNLTACRQLASAALLNTSVPCPASPCSFEGHYQPTLPTNMDFFAYSAFAYTYQAYFPTATTVSKVSLASFDAANANWCSQNYSYIRSLFSTTAQPDALLKRYCWSGSYFTQLLTVYGFQPNVENIYFGTSVKNIEITWALGSMLSDAALLPYSPNPTPTTTGSSSSDVSHGYCLSGLLVILVACLML